MTGKLKINDKHYKFWYWMAYLYLTFFGIIAFLLPIWLLKVLIKAILS